MKLLDRFRQTNRFRHFSYRTEQAYVFWIERFIRYHAPFTSQAATSSFWPSASL
jgi:hypothetical protein